MKFFLRLCSLFALLLSVFTAKDAEEPIGPDSHGPPSGKEKPSDNVGPPTILPPDTPPGFQKTEETAKEKNPLARGWGNDIDWVSFQEGFSFAREQQKPIMLIIHKTWCHACKNLRRMFGKAKQIAKLSRNFVMVNVENGEEPADEEYKPDGNYIPRIFFLNPQGQVLYDVVNPKKEFPDTKYYYSNPAPVITAMEKVIKRFETKTEKTEL